MNRRSKTSRSLRTAAAVTVETLELRRMFSGYALANTVTAQVPTSGDSFGSNLAVSGNTIV